MKIEIEPFFDASTSTLSYVVHDTESRDAVVIDPVLDFDPIGSVVSMRSVETIEQFVRRRDLRVHFVFDTHAHADHLTGSRALARRLGARVAIGARIREVQEVFRDVFDLSSDFPTDGRQFDRLLDDGEVVSAGTIAIEVIATPGHTPACVTYKIDDAIFTGDALFVEDYGTGRCDFPRGSADALYTSVHDRLYALPDATRVFVGHDYQPGGRAMRFETTIGISKTQNVQLRERTKREDFVRFRRERDATLSSPRLLYPSLQVNIVGGTLPALHANGRRYFSVPFAVNERRTAGPDET